MKMRFRALSWFLAVLMILACAQMPALATELSSPYDANGNYDVNKEPGLMPYDPPVDITTWKIIHPGTVYEGDQTPDDNVYYNGYRDVLGINLINTWAVANTGTGGAADQKRNVSIASGDIPDVMELTDIQWRQLADAGMLADLTDAFDKYASKQLKEQVYNPALSDCLAATTIDGRIMGLGQLVQPEQTFYFMFIRHDWLENLKLPEPKTFEDFINIAIAFTNDDPDGNGQNDTYGFAMTSDLFDTTFADMSGFAQCFGAYPEKWVKDEANDTLVFGSIQPEMKQALLKMQELMAAGAIDKEFGVKKFADASKETASGRAGMEIGTWNNTQSGRLQDSVANDENADWRAYRLPSATGEGFATTLGAFPVGSLRYYAVSKDCEHPEALVKMLNFYADRRFGAVNGDPNTYTFHNNIEVTGYANCIGMPADKNMVIQAGLRKYYLEGDDSLLNAEAKTYVEQIQKYLDGDRNYWYRWASFGMGGTYDVCYDMLLSNDYQRTAYYGTPTPTQSTKGDILRSLTISAFTEIINGAPIDNFDKYVADWKALGGDQWTAEVQDWYAAQK